MKRKSVSSLVGLILAVIAMSLAGVWVAAGPATASPVGYAVVDTGQGICYDNNRPVACPAESDAFYGQDAQYSGAQPSYVDNGDGTVTDNITGLMWQKSPDTNGDGSITSADKLTYDEAIARGDALNLAGYDDWRLPTIKELYSLIDFGGIDFGPGAGNTGVIPFIDAGYFDFAYGDTAAGERPIDAQYWSSTEYASSTMNGIPTTFGVNFADGRIKGYGRSMPGREMAQFVRYVRGNADYGINYFFDNGDGTVTDQATGLMWIQTDSGQGMNWESALEYCECLDYAGYSDWRLPDVKELQSIVDYSRSPDTTGSAAIDPVFTVTTITNEAGQVDYPSYWSSTTHVSQAGGMAAAYVAFGRAMGYMHSTWMDVHGAGAQRADFKAGDPADYEPGRGPQGDAMRIYNYTRCVRGGDVTVDRDGDPTSVRPAMTVDYQDMRPLTGGGPQQPGGGLQQPDGQPPSPGGPGAGGMNAACRPDLSVAAQALNITVERLRRALGEPGQGPPDLNAVAANLGISADALRQALDQAMPDGCAQTGPPPHR